MTHNEFFQAIKAGEVRSAYLFQGEEEHIKQKALQALREALLPPGLEAVNETVLMNPPSSDIIAAAETLPMLAERRLVQVHDSALLGSGRAAGESEEAGRLAEYLAAAPDTACIVFYCRGMADGRKKLAQALTKQGAVVRFDALSDPELQRWIAAQAKGQGKTITQQNAVLLAFTAGHELLTLGQEIAKLAAHAGERTEILQEDIETVATLSLECTVFQLVDALVEGKEAEALRLLRVMLENGEGRIGILAMLARQYRNLLYYRTMKDRGVPEGEMQKRLGVPAFAFRKLAAQARNMQTEALRDRLTLCVDTDYAIKTGKMREEDALERAIFRLKPEI